MRPIRNKKSMNIHGVFCRAGWWIGNTSYYLPFTLPSFFVWFSLWAAVSKAQMSFNIWKAHDCTIRAVKAVDILPCSVWFSMLIDCWLLLLLPGVWIESLGCMITFKWHPLRMFAFELVIFQVSLPWQQFCSWGLQPRFLHLHFPWGDSTKHHRSVAGWNLPLSSLALAGEAHLSAAFMCAAWMLPLMWFLFVFSLLEGELAQTFLGVLTQLNEQLTNGV